MLSPVEGTHFATQGPIFSSIMGSTLVASARSRSILASHGLIRPSSMLSVDTASDSTRVLTSSTWPSSCTAAAAGGGGSCEPI